MFKITLELPETIEVELGTTGLVNKVPVRDIAEHPEVIRFAVINGFMKALNDVSRGKHEDGEALTDAQWCAARQKRIDNAWLVGEWAGRGGGANGERLGSLAFELYLESAAKSNGVEAKLLAKAIDQKVKDTYGKDAKLTVENKVNAICKARADANKGDLETEVAAWEGEWFDRAREAMKARAAVKIDLSKIDL